MVGLPKEDGLPPEHPIQVGNRNFRGCLFFMLGAVPGGAACATLAIWGGSIGRGIVAALGFGLAGFLLPYFSGAEARGGNQERFLIWFSGVTGLGGLVFGAWLGGSGADVPWWVFAGAGLVSTFAGGAVGFWAKRRFERS